MKYFTLNHNTFCVSINFITLHNQKCSSFLCIGIFTVQTTLCECDRCHNDAFGEIRTRKYMLLQMTLVSLFTSKHSIGHKQT